MSWLVIKFLFIIFELLVAAEGVDSLSFPINSWTLSLQKAMDQPLTKTAAKPLEDFGQCLISRFHHILSVGFLSFDKFLVIFLHVIRSWDTQLKLTIFTQQWFARVCDIIVRALKR